MTNEEIIAKYLERKHRIWHYNDYKIVEVPGGGLAEVYKAKNDAKFSFIEHSWLDKAEMLVYMETKIHEDQRAEIGRKALEIANE